MISHTLPAVTVAIRVEIEIFSTQGVVNLAVLSGCERVVTLGVTGCADRLYAIVMSSGVSVVMVVFMASLASGPHMTAVCAGQGIWMLQPPSADHNIHALPCLLGVSVTRWHRRRAELSRPVLTAVAPADVGLLSHWQPPSRRGR